MPELRVKGASLKRDAEVITIVEEAADVLIGEGVNPECFVLNNMDQLVEED
jgi:hypothetical protein